MCVLGFLTQEETILETVALMGLISSHVLLGTRTYMHTPSLILGYVYTYLHNILHGVLPSVM